MSPDPTPEAGTRPDADPPEPRRKPVADYAPKIAALAVAAVAVTAAFMGARQEPAAEPLAGSAPPPRQAVVRAPPLIVAAPPLQKAAPPARGMTRSMGAAPACDRCGVVESVEAATPGQGFQMRIRMDDGSTRTLEQRGALAAGTRVMVEGGSVRLMPG